MSKISIIIPVYNVEKYLSKCLDSVINQTYKDIEIICINDGSTDNSFGILEDYAQKDIRIKIINKKNEGVSIARNIGINQSNGEYIIFLDSDDWIESNTCELSIDCIKKHDADICCFGINEIVKDNINIREWESPALKKEILQLEDKKILMVNACGKLFKRSFLLNNNISFPEMIKTGEDAIFNLTCLCNNAKYITLNERLYNYLCDRNDSATNNIKNAINSDIAGYKYFFNQLIFKKANETYKILIIEKFIEQIIYYYNKSSDYRIKYGFEIFLFYCYLRMNFSLNLLSQVDNFGFFKQFSPLKFIFSIRNTNDKKHNVITILGIKIKFKRNN